MIETIEIQIFLSNPSDVDLEKQIVQNVCDRINDQLSAIDCSVRYLVKEWKKIIGSFGPNPQMEIESIIGEYDIYFGIWWKKFGSNTGIINPDNGEDYGSGTYREFALAYNSWMIKKAPTIYLFFKKEITNDLFDENVHNELSKVIDFEKSQQPNGFCNRFKNDRDFERKITDELWKKATQLCMGFKKKQKQEFLDEEIEEDIKLKINNYNSRLLSLPQEYITRSIIHFSSLKDKQRTPFLQLKEESIDKLMLTQNRVALLGDAGSGKSTELQNLFFKLNQKDSPLIPIFQNLNTYTPEHGLEAFLPEFWRKVPESLLLIIWDGLDELQPGHFNTVVRQITNFSERHKEIRIIISCRTNFYELPVNNSPGTLVGFEPYFINDLNIADIKNYHQKKYPTQIADKFIKEVHENNLADLIAKPFFLMLIADNYVHEERLSINRAALYEMFLLNRIELDEYHYKGAFDIREKKQEIIHLLEKVALSMEILSRNHINESEILQILTSDEFKTLRYCTAFKKKDGEENIWQFEHNNIQEYLASKALSGLEYDKVIKFLTFEPQNKKLIPSWVNTLGFLFSILQTEDKLFKQLLQWMLDNEKEVIIKFERDKIPEELRVKIFQEIFNFYKKYDVWISSNKFNDKQLAQFGQSETNIQFLVTELKNNQNSRVVKINAIRLIGHFNFEKEETKQEVKDLLLNHIEANTNDHTYIYSSIYALKWAELANKDIIKHLMILVGERKNQNIRAAVYAVLLASDTVDEYVEYLIEGYELLDKKVTDERDNVSLLNEELNLKECVKNVKSSEGIRKLFEYISETSRFDFSHDRDEVLKAIINNAINAYPKDHAVYDVILNWFIKDIKALRMENANFVILFLERTDTRKKAFYEIWETKEDKERIKSLAIAKLITSDLMDFVIDQYNNHDLTNRQLEEIYYDMRWAKNEEIDKFETLIKEKTDHKIKQPKQIDYGVIRQKKLEADFKLLFDGSSFFKETIRLFDELEKDVLTFEEIHEIEIENNKYVEKEDYYSEIALRLLRDLANSGQTVNKKRVLNWFEKEEREEWYRISLIYEYLSNNKDIEVNEEQEKWIIEWCKENVSKVNFRKALEIDSNRNTTFEWKAVYIWYFLRKFNITFSKKVLLDMLSFDFFEDHKWVGIDYLIPKLEKRDVENRILENLQKGIPDTNVLKNHVKYVAQNTVKEGYPFILGEILNTQRQGYNRREILDLYFESTKDTKGLKTILDKIDSEIKWVVIDKLTANNEESFVEEYLLSEIDNIDSEERGKAAEVLVTLQNIKGLGVYVEWIKSSTEKDIDLSQGMCLSSLKSKDAIPHLMELLELSYKKKIKVDKFDHFISYVIGALNNIAFVSQENFNEVKSKLEEFRQEKESLHENVKYLLYTIEKLEEQFYMNHAQSYTIREVKEKLMLIQ